MPWFEVVALEKFLVRTTYRVKAPTVEEAKRRIQAGEEAYDLHQIVEGEDEFLEFESADETPSP